MVQTYIDSDDLYEVREIQNNLLTYYEEDFSKHAPKEVVPRIMMVWNSIPSQLAKENRSSCTVTLREGARAKDFELAIQWLEDAGLILRSYRVSKPDIPLIAYMEMNSFKMFMFDVGLLTARPVYRPDCCLTAAVFLKSSKGRSQSSMSRRSCMQLDIHFIILRQSVQRVKLISCYREILIASRLK